MFSILSVKRNRSTNTNRSTKPKSKKAHTDNTSNTVPKTKFLSKIKSAFTKSNEGIIKRNSSTGLLQYFRGAEDDQKRFEINTGLGRNPGYDSDGFFEYSCYHARKNSQKLVERNVHTLPLTPTKKLSGILVKRSPTCNLPSLTKLSTKSTHFTASTTEHRNSSEMSQRKFNDQYNDQMQTFISSWVSRDDNAYQEQAYNIWDPQFWMLTPKESNSSQDIIITNFQEEDLPSPIVEPPILTELRRSSSHSCVIKKGRFEITYDQA